MMQNCTFIRVPEEIFSYTRITNLIKDSLNPDVGISIFEAVVFSQHLHQHFDEQINFYK
jgi:hypothetical protein